MKKIEKNHRLLNTFASYFIVVAGGVSGIFASEYCTDAIKKNLVYAAICCILITTLMFLLSYFAKKRFIKQKQKATLEENDRYYTSLLNSANKVSKKKLALIKFIRCSSETGATIFGLFAFIIPFAAGVNCGNLFLLVLAVSAFMLFQMGAIIVGLLSMSIFPVFIIMLGIDFANNLFFYFLFAFFALIPARTALERTRLGMSSKAIDECKSILSAADYPFLYSIAFKASETVGFKGNVRLAVDFDSNVKIAKMNDTCTILIGIIFLSQASEEELFTIFLHEFAHWSGESSLPGTEVKYALFLKNIPKNFFNIAFYYFDEVYTYHYNTFFFISSKLNEQAADEVMIRYGNASSAVSALLKLGYYHLYEWENLNNDFESIYALNRLSNFFLEKRIKLFEKSLIERKNAWNQLIESEISSPGETHPILKKRFETFGVTEYNTEPKASSVEYVKEYSLALKLAENIIYRNRLTDFDKQREAVYLNPKSKIEDWEANGKPIYVHNYAEISYYLRLLGRVSEAYMLFDEAIQMFSEKEAAYALLFIGYKKLHNYDETGIEYVYRAIGLNRMYATNGLHDIEQFCRFTGNQKEFDKCREMSIETLQKNKDIDKELAILRKKDNLTAEILPGRMRDKLINHVIALGGRNVKNIYVIRKTISEDLFTTAIIVRFIPQANLYTQILVLNNIRSFTETLKDRQFSVFRYQKVAKAKVENIDSSCIYVSQ